MDASTSRFFRTVFQIPFLSLASCFPLQAATVVGRVLLEPGGAAVSGTTVTLGGTRLWLKAQTDESGTYTFPNATTNEEYLTVYLGEGVPPPDGVATLWTPIEIKSPVTQAPDIITKLPQSISGIVRDDTTGAPATGVTVSLVTAYQERVRSSVTTDGQGRYCFYVRSGTYAVNCEGSDDRYYPKDLVVKVNRPGLSELFKSRSREDFKRHYDVWNTPFFGPQHRIIEVAPEENVENVDFRVWSAPPYQGSVTFSNGQSAKGLEVVVDIFWSGSPVPMGGPIDAEGIGKSFHLRTDPKGVFVGYLKRPYLRDWDEKITLKATVLRSDKSVGGVAYATATTSIPQIGPLRIVLAETCAATVEVGRANGMAITDAIVSAIAEEEGRGRGPRQSDPRGEHLGNGKYEVTGLVPGLSYFLVAESPGSPAILQITTHFRLNAGETRDLGKLTLE